MAGNPELLDHVIGVVMSRAFAGVFARNRWSAGFIILAVSLLTSGFSSCAGTTGPLFAPLTITPSEVLLRASLAAKGEAIGLARIDAGTGRDRYRATVEYQGKAATEQSWLTVEFSGNEITLRAAPGGLEVGTYLATATIEDTREGNSGPVRVEFQVIP